MTQLLQKAWAEVVKLPEKDQDAVAAWLLEELASELRWEKTFRESQDALGKLADEALAEFHAGKTRPLKAETL